MLFLINSILSDREIDLAVINSATGNNNEYIPVSKMATRSERFDEYQVELQPNIAANTRLRTASFSICSMFSSTFSLLE